MIINIYNIGCKKKLVKNLRVKSQYDANYYFDNMPTIGARTCKKIIKENGLYNGENVIIENVKTGFKDVCGIFKDGTIINI